MKCSRTYSLLLLATCAISASPATAATGQIVKVNPPGVPKPLGAYSHMAVVPPGSKLLYLAGQVGNRADGTLPSTVEDQTIQAWENIRAILAAEGAGMEHIVKIITYAAARPTDRAKLGRHRNEIFQGMMPPPSTIVYVSGLAAPHILVEVEVIAAVPMR